MSTPSASSTPPTGHGEPRTSHGGHGAHGGPHDGDDDRGLRERLEKLLPDLVRRAFHAGTSAISNTEDGIRRIMSDLNLPKEVATYLMLNLPREVAGTIMSQASSSKDEVLRIVSQELRRFLENVNLSGELQKLLTSLSFEIKTEIRFIPNDAAIGQVKPEVKNKVAVKRSGE